MAARKKVVYKSFTYLQCDAFAEYLMAMARKGWHFREWKAGLVFEPGAPEEVVYAVEVFSGGSEYDTRPAANTQEFAEYCAAAGWELVDGKRKFCVFRRTRPDAVPILTPQERFQNIADAARPGFRWPFWTYGVMFAMELWSSWGIRGQWVVKLFSNGLLLVFAMYMGLFLMSAIRYGQFLRWFRDGERKLAQGEAVYCGRSRNPFAMGTRWNVWVFCGIFVLLLALMVGGDFAGVGAVLTALFPPLLVMGLIAYRRPDSATHQVVRILCIFFVFLVAMVYMMISAIQTFEEPANVSTQGVPLLYEDLGGQAGALEEVYLDGSESILGKTLTCRLTYEDVSVRYQLYRADIGWILDRVWERQRSSSRFEQNCWDVTELWGVEEALVNGEGDCLIRDSDGVWVLSLGLEEPTPEQIQTIRTALKEGW